MSNYDPLHHSPGILFEQERYNVFNFNFFPPTHPFAQQYPQNQPLQERNNNPISSFAHPILQQNPINNPHVQHTYRLPLNSPEDPHIPSSFFSVTLQDAWNAQSLAMQHLQPHALPDKVISPLRTYINTNSLDQQFLHQMPAAVNNPSDSIQNDSKSEEIYSSTPSQEKTKRRRKKLRKNQRVKRRMLKFLLAQKLLTNHQSASSWQNIHEPSQNKSSRQLVNSASRPKAGSRFFRKRASKWRQD